VVIDFKGGRLPHDANPPRLVMENYLTATPTPPASADWVAGVKTWPMLLNDQLGDCTVAGAGHIAQQVNWFGRDQNSTPTDADTLAAYEAISGYKPGQPATDVGATLQSALDYWHKTGLGGNKIAAFAQVKATDLATIRMCIARFGSVYCGMWVPQAAMDQFDAGKPWTVAKRSANLGGHCVPLMAYDADNFTCVTWGRAQAMSLAFFKAQFDEVWVPIDLDWLRSNGLSPAGIDTTALNGDYASMTGQAGPFPAVTPTPSPTPTPTPSGSRAADVTLATAFDAWRRQAGV
jgi:hypothetical protein